MGRLGFPDKYYLLTIDEQELRKRKENDLFNTRRNFELHLGVIDPQRRYFQFLSTLRNDYVVFIEAISIVKNIETVLKMTAQVNKHSVDQDLMLFDKLVEWIKNNKAEVGYGLN